MFLSCSDMNRLKLEVHDIAEQMNKRFLEISAVAARLKTLAENFLNNTDFNKADISGMDENDGGSFYTFRKGKGVNYIKHYSEKTKDECNVGSWGNLAVTDDLKREMQALTALEPDFIKIFNSNPYLVEIDFIGVDRHDYGIGYPNADTWSVLSPPFQWRETYTFKYFSTQGKNGIVWRVPTLALGSVFGITHWAGTAVYQGKELAGIVLAGMKPFVIAEDLLKGKSDKLMITWKDTNVYGATESLKKEFSIRLLKEMGNLTEQQRRSVDINKDYALISEIQEADIRKLGQMITEGNAGKDDLKIEIAGKTYRVFIEYLETTGYYVVGLL